MNARLSKVVLSIVLIVVFALGIAPLAGAQEGPQPEAVGLRPDAPPYAMHGPYWVGTRDLIFEPDSERPLAVTVWFPALNPEGAAEAVTYNYLAWGEAPVTTAGHALLEAVPDAAGAPYPLVIFSHGHFLWRQQSTFLTEHLASWGFVVMAVDHFGNTTTTNPPEYGDTSPPHNYLRVVDIGRAMDFAESLTAADGALVGLIDAATVGVMGHSFGGLTALQAGGAGLDFDYFATSCEQNPEGACPLTLAELPQLAALAGLDAVPEGVWPPFMDDDRVKAIVPLAPAAMRAGPKGAATVDVPTLMFTGSADTSARPEFHVHPVYEGLGTDQKALVIFGDAEHFIYLDSCEALPWMVEWGMFGFCADPVWDMDRAHDLANHFTTAFLLATLKDDAEAAAALAPDAVQFPGITYEATGF